MDRTNAISSTHVAMCGNRLETSRPHWPYFWKGNGLRRINRGLAHRFAWSVFFSLLQSITVLSNFSSAGLGSKESIWLTPPSIDRKIQDLAFGLWCGVFGASGFEAAVAARMTSASAMPPTPVKLP